MELVTNEILKGFTSDFSLIGVAAAVTFSLSLSVLAMLLYNCFFDAQATGSRIHRAFPLIGLACTMMFISVQMSLPLSLGLLGALSIVRFRTPIKEPEEIGFLMLVIAGSITCSVSRFIYALILYGAAVGALVILRFSAILGDGSNAGTIMLSMDESDFLQRGENGNECLRSSLVGLRQTGSSARDGRVSLVYTFRRLRKGVSWQDLHRALKELISSMELDTYGQP